MGCWTTTLSTRARTVTSICDGQGSEYSAALQVALESAYQGLLEAALPELCCWDRSNGELTVECSGEWRDAGPQLADMERRLETVDEEFDAAWDGILDDVIGDPEFDQREAEASAAEEMD